MGNLRILLPDDQSEMVERARDGCSDGVPHVEIGRPQRGEHNFAHAVAFQTVFTGGPGALELLKNCRQVRSSTGKTDR
jgi:hypothetical protein